MNNTLLSPELYRVIDANLNRLKEGIRVVEDIMRYSYNNKELSLKLKHLRHLAIIDETIKLLEKRNTIHDVLRETIESELKRTNIENIFIANFKRAQESARVLEEIFKLSSPEYSERFKHIRYELYDLEKNILLNKKR